MSVLNALLTYEDLAQRWGRDGKAITTRQVRRICARWKLEALDFGHRTKRFRPADVEKAEARAAGERVR